LAAFALFVDPPRAASREPVAGADSVWTSP
jgi:hypothetical protein